MSNVTNLYTLNICSSLYVKYSFINLRKRKTLAFTVFEDINHRDKEKSQRETCIIFDENLTKDYRCKCKTDSFIYLCCT